MKYFSRKQILESLNRIANFNQFFGLTFLAAKRAELPVGNTVSASLDTITEKFLKDYYLVDSRSKFYFRVFRFNNTEQFWLRPDYSGKGLQKLNATSFKDAFIHPKKSKLWGWQNDYVTFLSSLLPHDEKIPIFHLAVWLFKDHPWDDDRSRKDVIKKFLTDFHISPQEKDSLFSTKVESALSEGDAFQPIPTTWHDLESAYCAPPDIGPEKGGILSFLEFSGIGPVSPLRFDPGKRLNIITGDNGLGKTFLLEVAWWALTGKWADRPVYPNQMPGIPPKGQIKFQISGTSASLPQVINFNPSENRWPEPRNRATISGLIVYARVDGSFALWDPAGSSSSPSGESFLVFDRDEVWDGFPGRMEGLVRDWTKWQDKTKVYPFDIFKKVLARLSPPEMGILTPGEPVRLPLDPREIPTIKHPYGEVPIIFESAGVRRIITLAYLIVWAWNEHKVISEQTGRDLETRMVILIDEIEAHLHPKWQRAILPAILGVSTDLSSALEIQIMVSSHSPLVLASVESLFDNNRDKLFHLDLTKSGKVLFFPKPFISYGPIDSWLTSDVFSLAQARSKEAEEIIEKAVKLQKEMKPLVEDVKKIHNILSKLLPAEDRFWPRWVFFANKHGVEL
jgi:hypothetical protein